MKQSYTQAGLAEMIEAASAYGAYIDTDTPGLVVVEFKGSAWEYTYCSGVGRWVLVNI